MFGFATKPHVSAALLQLQRSVAACVVLVALCVAAQLIVLGCVHFTDIRWITVETPAAAQPLTVVKAPPAGELAGAMVAVEPPPPSAAAAEPRRELTSWDAVLRVVSVTATSVGVVACLLLGLVTTLGVIIAAGPGVPGVQRAVSACVWAMLLGIVCLPLHVAVPSTPWRGVFGPYAEIVAMSEAVNAGATSVLLLLGQHALVPIVALVASVMVLVRFRAGVADGVIVQSISDVERKLEAEIDQIRRQGPSVNAVRSVAALNQAIGDRPADPAPSIRPAVADPVAPDEPRCTDAARKWQQRRIGAPDAGEPLKRLI